MQRAHARAYIRRVRGGGEGDNEKERGRISGESSVTSLYIEKPYRSKWRCSFQLLPTVPCPMEEEEMKWDNCDLCISSFSASEFRPLLEIIQICCSNAALSWLMFKTSKERNLPCEFLDWNWQFFESSFEDRDLRTSRHYEIANDYFYSI